MLEVCGGLKAIHELGVLHRDVKVSTFLAFQVALYRPSFSSCVLPSFLFIPIPRRFSGGCMQGFPLWQVHAPVQA